jgi:hypothetical protein
MTNTRISILLVAALSGCAIDNESEPELASHTQAVAQPPPPACIGDEAWSSAYCDIASIIGDISEGVKIFSGITGPITTIEKILQFIGALPTVSPFAALSAQLNQLAGSLSWQAEEINRNDLVSTLHGAATDAREWLIETNNQPLPFDSAPVADSIEALTALEPDLNFQRLYTTAIFDPSWSTVVQARPTQSNGYVYDWRLGVPVLIYGISLRVLVMGAEDPSFKTNPAFHSELLQHHDALAKQIAPMSAGVHCGVLTAPSGGPVTATMYTAKVRCADINTGASLKQDFPLGPVNNLGCEVFNPFLNIYTLDQTCVANAGYQLEAQHMATFTASEDSLRRSLLLQMPLFDIQAVVDMLYMYAYPTMPELTQKYSRIPLFANPNLCLDVAGGVNANGTPVQLYTCNATAAQHWTYDRGKQTITNTAFNKCLDVRGADPTAGAVVQIYDCNGTDAQRWTWDPQAGVLLNARGNVLDVAGGNLVSGTPVKTWTKNGTPAQRWYADPLNIIIGG